MRHLVLSFVALLSQAVTGAVQHRWSCETSEINEEAIAAYHGETVELSCLMTSYGQVVSCSRGGGAWFCWQTNGMANAWWTTNAVFSGGTVKANWTPFMDVGADSYRFFFKVEDAKGANYRANGTIALLGSPAGEARYLPLPTRFIDYKDVTVLNPTNAPWEMKGGGVVVERDPTVGLTNNTVYASGTNRTFLVEHQSLAFTNDYRRKDAKINWEDVTNHAEFVTASVTNGLASTAWVEGKGYATTTALGGKLDTASPSDSSTFNWDYGSLYLRSSGDSYAMISPSDISLYYYNSYYGYWTTLSLTDMDYSYSSQLSYLSSSVYYMQNDISYLYSNMATMDWVSTEIYNSIDAGNERFKSQVEAAAPIDSTNPTFNSEVNASVNAQNVHFSNEVLAVGLHLDVRAVEEINELTRNGSFASNCWLVVDNYFQNNSIVKSVLKDRTDKIGEFGTGWGYMLYDWTSDMRTWLLYVPELGLAKSMTSLTTNRYVTLPDVQGTAHTAVMLEIPSHPLITEVFHYSSSSTKVDLVRTDEKYVIGTTNGCRYVTYDVGAINMSNDMYFNVRVSDVDVQNAGYSLVPSLGVSNATYITTHVGTVGYETHGVPYVLTQTITNIETTVVGTTVTLSYDLHSVAVFTSEYLQGGTQTVTWESRPTFSFTFSHAVGGLVPVAVTKVRMATVGTSHYYWDADLKRTWEIKIRNGCLYSEIVSDENLTEKE